MMNFFNVPLDVTKRLRLNCLSCWRLRREICKHPKCRAQWRESLPSWRDLPSRKTPFVMRFLSSSSVSPVLDRASCVSPWWMPAYTVTWLDKAELIFLRLFASKMPGCRQPWLFYCRKEFSGSRGQEKHQRVMTFTRTSHQHSGIDGKPDSLLGREKGKSSLCSRFCEVFNNPTVLPSFYINLNLVQLF